MMYKDLNDYEILYMVSEKDDASFNILYAKYQPLIYKIVKNYTKLFKKYGYELEDLMQIGYLTLYKASYLYKDYDNTKFYTYVVKAITNAIYREIKANETLKRNVLNNSLSYDKKINDSDESYIDILPDLKVSTGLSEREFILFKNSMSFEMGNIFEMFMNGYNFNEMSILLSYDIKMIRNNFRKIKQHAFTYKSLFFS